MKEILQVHRKQMEVLNNREKFSSFSNKVHVIAFMFAEQIKLEWDIRLFILV